MKCKEGVKGEKNRKRERERQRENAGLRHAGSMPANYECKVMVILISCAKRKNGRDRTVCIPSPLARPSSASLSVALAYIIQNVLSYISGCTNRAWGNWNPICPVGQARDRHGLFQRAFVHSEVSFLPGSTSDVTATRSNNFVRYASQLSPELKIVDNRIDATICAFIEKKL